MYYFKRKVSVAACIAVARPNREARFSCGDGRKLQQRSSTMETWKQWLAFRTPSFSCPFSYCSTRKLSYTNVIINMKDDVSHKKQQKSDAKSLE